MLTDTSSSSKIYSYPVGRNITGHSFTIEVLQVSHTGQGATMSEIFVYDKNPCKRPEKDIYDYVSRLAPRAPYTYVNVGKGLILKFQNEEDTNFIFTPSAILSFETHNLNVSLTIHSQRARNIYISNPRSIPEILGKSIYNGYLVKTWCNNS